MDYNLVTNNATCHKMIMDTVPFTLVYYSHIPTAIIASLVGFFVFFKDPKGLLNRILLGLSLTFSLWLVLDQIVWVMNYNTILTMLAWTPLELLNALFFFFALYFVYVYIDKKDISFAKKIILGLLLLPIIVLAPFKYLDGFTMVSCEAIENGMFVDYVFYFEVLIAAWIILLSIQRYIKADKETRKQIVLLGIGITLFLLMFFSASYIAVHYGDFDYELYGHFGMTVFMGFLAYLIVKFKAFNIKMLAAQALVVSLVALVGSEFFFTPFENTTNVILISVTLLLSVIFGMVLVDSIKKEVQRKEELQTMSDKLAEANDQLRKLDNSKSEFISIASHQLRTPLTAIKGFISLLLEGSYGKMEPKQEDVLNKVYTSNERLVTLVEDLLNISRIESGRMEFKFAPWDINRICQEVVDTFIPKAKDLNLSLEYKAPEGRMPELMIDGAKVREVISNMVDNALKYTPKGGVKVNVEFIKDPARQKLQDKDGVVRVTISDTGIGIPVAELPYLFAKFSRGKDISRLNTGGTGLGLYVGKSMIESNGGTIWAESDGEGRGSRFLIELPVGVNQAEIDKRFSNFIEKI